MIVNGKDIALNELTHFNFTNNSKLYLELNARNCR